MRSQDERIKDLEKRVQQLEQEKFQAYPPVFLSPPQLPIDSNAAPSWWYRDYTNGAAQ